eukprot:4580578-Amphidinium_carterae.1
MLPAAGAPNTPRPGALTAGSSKALLIEAVKVFQRSGGHERWQLGRKIITPTSLLALRASQPNTDRQCQ